MRIENSNFDGILIDYQTFKFGKVYFFKNIIVSEINEGIVLTYDIAEQFLRLIDKYYDEQQNVVYISNRVNSYSVKPIDWLKINNKYKNLIAIGIIHYNRNSKNIFDIEKLFCRRTFKGFDNLEDGLVWANHIANKRTYNNPVSKKN
ncbi:hypothetical protein [Abyssalbus ytuae]|uniref:STAS/SEC14 domain-containing protein n=1 Tax=Abyssalbus ytuae TaxID=2926907 RepID=A0A9E6ZKE7_9FLAO|nr:hypothetical protein [Abyssalbus ytuae]UOB17309.1 hypothetical protein MQE35_16430 [Abyssalbus ytuae]